MYTAWVMVMLLETFPNFYETPGYKTLPTPSRELWQGLPPVPVGGFYRWISANQGPEAIEPD